ncbi:IS110 family transposase [Corynebacterium diphtheriae]|nr:IS110 family transposase [Corynebacterium diphtheriae]
MSQEHYIDISLGLDVGKTEHHACALDREGNKLFDKPLPQVESDLAKLFNALQQHRTVLVVVDQSNPIGALPIAVARDRDCQVGYLPWFSHAQSRRSLPQTCKNGQTRRLHHRRYRADDATHPSCSRPEQ